MNRIYGLAGKLNNYMSKDKSSGDTADTAAMAVLPGTYQHDEEEVRIQCAIPKQTKVSQILAVIDISGSMHYNMGEVKEAVSYMVQDAVYEPTFILYNHLAWVATKEQVLNQGSCGGTSFIAAFRAIMEWMSKTKLNSDVDIIFMTDGQSGDSHLANEMELFKGFLKKHSTQNGIIVHTLGFGRGAAMDLLNAMSEMGSRPGISRYLAQYAEGESLQTSLAALHDCIASSRNVTINLGGYVVQDSAGIENNQLAVDVILKMSKLSYQTGKCIEKDQMITVEIESGETKFGVELKCAPMDVDFKLISIERSQPNSMEEVDNLQHQLTKINPMQVELPAANYMERSAKRIQFVLRWQKAGKTLLKYRAIFLTLKDNKMPASGILGELKSLQSDHVITTGQQRRLQMREAKSQKESSKIDEKLTKLKDEITEKDIEEWKALVAKGNDMAPTLGGTYSMQLVCPLSRADIVDVMTDTADDVMVLTLMVTRPNRTIDDPTKLEPDVLAVGSWSFGAFLDFQKNCPPDAELNQLTENVRKPMLENQQPENKNPANIGLGMQGTKDRANAILPLFINKKHWERVWLMRKQLLSWFFLQSATGYHGNQCVALYAIYAKMLAKRSLGVPSFQTDWASEILDNQLREVCKHLEPLMEQYSAGLYDNFIAGPDGRSKSIVGNLLVIPGIQYSKGYSMKDPKYAYPVFEEYLRRSFSSLYQYTSETDIDILLLQLLYGDPEKMPKAESKARDWGFTDEKIIEHIRYVWAELESGEKPTKELEIPLPASEPFTHPGNAIEFSEQPDYFKMILEKSFNQIKELAKTSEMSTFLPGSPLGVWDESVYPGDVVRIMFIQALYTRKMNLLKCANTYVMYQVNAAHKILIEIGNDFQEKQKSNWDNVARQQVERDLGVYIAQLDNIHVFAGLVWIWASNRGTRVFQSLLEAVKTTEVPERAQKIRAILSGNIYDEGVQRPCLAQGYAWNACPPPTIEVLKQRFEEAMGKTEQNSDFIAIQWAEIIKQMENAVASAAPKRANPNNKSSKKQDDATWDTYFGVLEDYLEANKKPPSTAAWHNKYNIGAWAHKQRTLGLYANRKNKLDSLNYWRWYPSWDEKFTMLKGFYESNKRLPTEDERIEGINFKQWIERQAARMADGRLHNKVGSGLAAGYIARFREIPELPQFALRGKACYKCKKAGHLAKVCPA